jgi:predicted hydrocarbon binding protein
MNRNYFLKKACGLGICSCVGAGLLSNGNLKAADEKKAEWKEGFVKYRFAKLIGILDLTLDEKTKNQILENLGKECANRSQSKQYINNLDGFFNDLRSRWGENASYDKEKGLIRIETPERECFCPMFDSKEISKSICQCSVGWQAQTYKTIFGKDVEAKCVESVIRGSKRCVFEVRILN